MSTRYEPGAPAEGGGIPLCVPEIGGNEWSYVRRCLDTGWVSSVGSFVTEFERSVADRVGVPHAVATVNGTAALHIALLLAGVEAGDEVVVSTLTFIAPVNAIRYVGAWPAFVDAEPEYWQMDAVKLADFLDHGCERRGDGLYNRATGRRVRAVVPVHILGHPVDMDPIRAAAERHGLPVIEDATESLGAEYRGAPVGSLGEAACFSFNGNKLITTGGGGMIVTRRDDWARRARYLTTQAKDDPLEYIHHEVGYNYRLTNIQAAVGVAQMERLDEFVARKREIADAYERAFADVEGLEPMRQAPWARSVFWMYTIRVREAELGLGSRELMRSLSERGIQSRPLWQPIHLSPAHQGSFATDCRVSELLNREALSLPCSVGLTEEQQQRVIRAVLEVSRARS